MTEPERPLLALPDLVAHVGAILAVPALAVRLAARDAQRPELVPVAWTIGAAGLLTIAVGVALSLLRSTRPSPAVWGLLVFWVLVTGVILLEACG
ncbi:hypothetical protein ACFVSN_06895 [Kitasatospora sp. NPDC057904]|uniref:hypothetical protein n=1 Tax=unclassified Kitasatospora TaxID=2633591 RepID=UPI00369EF32B